MTPLSQQQKSLKKKVKKETRSMKKSKRSLKKTQTKQKEKNIQFADLDCEGVLQNPLDVNFDNCSLLKGEIENLTALIDQKKEEINQLKQNITEQKKEITELKKKIAPYYSQKKKIENEELLPLQAELKAPKERLDYINAHFTERIGRVQTALDPQAVTMERSEDGEVLLNSFGLPDRTVDDLKQVNWIVANDGASTAGDQNTIILDPKKIEIEFRHWGDEAITYKTLYQKNDGGEESLSNQSEIFDLTFSGSEVLEFKFREKNFKGNLTGRIFAFKLQKSPFHIHTKLLGDITVTYLGKVVRRGQMKIILLRK
jgi:hypothetical protein